MKTDEEILTVMFQKAEAYARHYMNMQGTVRPAFMFTSADPDGPAGMIMHAGEFSPNEKHSFQQTMRILCVAHNVSVGVFISEIWVTRRKLKPGETVDPDMALDEMPSEALDREECVLLSGETWAGMECRLFKIIRHGNGKFFNLTPDEMPPLREKKGDKVSGQMAHLLAPGEAPAPIRNAARDLLRKLGLDK